MKLVFTTIVALLALAGNSVLCRLALGTGAIDAASFTNIRLLSGVVMLVILWAFNRGDYALKQQGSWLAAGLLFVYAAAFSYAYISLQTGAGALILFGAVQMTMILVSLIRGQRLLTWQWVGVCAAFSGLIVLVLPGLSAPPLLGFTLMALAGVAWGGYTLLGAKSVAPLTATTANFIRTLPFVGVLFLLSVSRADVTVGGAILAMLSGAVTSGIGYAIWYRVLAHLTTVRAAVLQLLVPILASFGGILFVAEALTMRLLIATALVLSGILLVILSRPASLRKG